MLRRPQLTAVAFSLVVFFTIECVLRLTLGPPPPPIRVFGGLVDRETWFRQEGSTWQFFDGRPLPRPGDIAVLGGSSVHGGTPGLTLADEFPGVAARITGRNVVNLGDPGLDSHDILRIVRELVKRTPEEGRPSTLVIYTGHNDYGNARFQARYGSLQSGILAHVQSTLEHSQIYVLVSRMLRPARGRLRERGVNVDTFPPLTDGAYEATTRHFQANIASILFVADNAQMKVLLVEPVSDIFAYPADQACTPTRCAIENYERGMKALPTDAARARSYLLQAKDDDRVALRAPQSVSKLFQTLANQYKDVDYLATFSVLSEGSSTQIPARNLFQDPIHLSAAGHARLGEALAQKLRTNGAD